MRTEQHIDADDAAEVVKTAHVKHNSGCQEWYTPSVYVEAARISMGGIDLDPASTPAANHIIQAETFYTADVDGLAQTWSGRVWLNPPYSNSLIRPFAEKLVHHLECGDVKQACVLTNNATETAWYATLMKSVSAGCFIKGRIRFLAEDGESRNTPLQGQVMLYYGDRTDEFVAMYSSMGLCWMPARKVVPV